MDIKKFSEKINISIQKKIKDESLLSKKFKLVRGDFIFNLFSYTNSIINYLSFKNDILFNNGKMYIKINDLYFEIVSRYFLKSVNKPFVGIAKSIIYFLNNFKFEPKIIIDVGACWGEYSMLLSKYYTKSTIYAIEGSYKNYNILNNNISFEKNNIDNIQTYNYIISDSNDFRYISNSIGTMNFVKNEIDKDELNYSKVKSMQLSNFIKENNLDYIDFLKLDIEGGELNLITDLLNLNIKYGQIEIINTNSFEKNIEFLNLLAKKYILIDEEDFKEISTNELKYYVKTKLDNLSAFDIFIASKK